MNDYPRDLLIKENIIRDMEDMMDVRFINKTESAEALKQHDAEIRRQTIDECLSVVEWDGYTLDIKRRIEALKEQMKGEQKLKEYEDSIRRQTLKEVESTMYHECFEVNHEEDGMQKWDGGNWIRYKLFEKVMEQMKEVRND